MVDSLKITSPIAATSKVQNFTKHPVTDAVFDLFNTESTSEATPDALNRAKDGALQPLGMDSSNMLLQPLLSLTGAQAQQYMELFSLLGLHLTPSDGAPDSLLDAIFVQPEKLLDELVAHDQARTTFKGESFAILKRITNQTDQPELKHAIASVLKYFDCRINRESSFNAILTLSSNFLQRLPAHSKDTQQLLQFHEQLLEQDPKDVLHFLKNRYISALVQAVKQHPENGKLRDSIIELIHYIVRFENAAPENLEESLGRLGELMRSIEAFRDIDVEEISALLMQHADEGQEEVKEKGPLLSLLSKALEDTAPTKMHKTAEQLLLHFIQNENPILPYGRFVVPVRYGDEETFGEFIVDEDCADRKGGAKKAVNIFFTIQSERYGSFEVDLLAKDRLIELDMKCPELLVIPLTSLKNKVKEITESEGYRLADYQVGVYREGRPLLHRYPKLEWRKVGIDVKI